MQPFPRKIRISLSLQRLELLECRESGLFPLASFPVSTSRYGAGSEPGSFRTPLGRFIVGEKIGEDAPLGAVFESRVLTGEIAELANADDPRDRITSRILWLEGMEEQNANTRERYIYIHGTNHEEGIGEPLSLGCVRLRNVDVVALFGQTPLGTEVEIEA